MPRHARFFAFVFFASLVAAPWGAHSAAAQEPDELAVPVEMDVEIPVITEADIQEADTAAAPEPADGNTFHAAVCPPLFAKAADAPDDKGSTALVSWNGCDPKYPAVSGYRVYRAEKDGQGYGPFKQIAELSADAKAGKNYEYSDEGLRDGDQYLYRVASFKGEDISYAFSLVSGKAITDLGPVLPERQIIAWDNRHEVSAGSAVAAPINVSAKDKPNDAGAGIIVSWTPPAAAAAAAGLRYNIYRSTQAEGDYKLIGSVGKERSEYADESHKSGPKDKDYYYMVAAADADGGLAVSEHSNAARAKVQLINWETWNFFLFALILSIFITYFIQSIKSGKKLFVRKIAGLEAIEESIGRATEMGKPVLFIPGILDMNDVQTVASIVILGRIARQVAEYDTRLMVPTSKSLVMTTGRETVKEAFISVGRPDAYNDDIVTYLTDEQFGYVAGVNGLMVRNKPATCLYFGAFFAESLILAETGNHIGAIQIAGTAQPAQLPFFIAACDYTLIGEELFAASAYLSHEPKLLGSLKGQDVGKLLGMGGMIFGGVFATIAEVSGAGWATSITEFFHRLFTAAVN